MCLTIRIRPLRPDGDGLGGLATDLPPVGDEVFIWRDSELSLHACGLLTDAADWNAPTWAMRPDGSASLAMAFATLPDRAVQPFAVEALWDGDQASETVEVRRGDLLDLVRAGALGTKTMYLLPARDIGER